jgi:NodT family efflux transporter outer membrane factor (OMF) lipoprotein
MKRMSTKGAFLSALLLSGCAIPNEPVAVSAVAPQSLGLGENAAPAVEADWWSALGDPQLDRIMTDALSGSPTLEAAMARVRLAQSTLSGSEAASRPQITGDASEQFQRLSSLYIIPPPYGGTFRWVGQAQANLNWNLDFWGRQADRIAQARHSAEATAFDYGAARLALTGTIAQTYVELARAERQIALAQSTVDQRSHAVKLADVRKKSQLSSDIDVRAAGTLLAQARQALIEAQGQRETVIHALALLAGHGADYYGTVQPSRLRLDAMLPLPATLPADLLARRPDILSAKASVAAAGAGRQVARKAYYPDVNLLGLAGLQALGIGNLFSSDASTYGAGAAIHLPIFEGGKLKADYAGATAQVDAAIADYNRTVLGAVRETADALTRVRTLGDDLAQQQSAANGLAEVQRLNAVRVSTGLDSRLDLIGSDVRLLAARQETVNLQADKAIAQIQLLIAVGGGFDPAGAAKVTETRTAP